MRALLKTPKLAAIVVAGLCVMRPAAAQELGEADCSTLRGQALAMCQDALRSNTASNVFLRLGQLLREQRNFELAVKVYSRGVKLHPNNSELRAKLTVARSGLEEQQWMQKRQQEEGQDTNAEVKAEVYKCKNLAKSAPTIALPACETALAAMPQDPQLLEAKGDALLKQGQPAEAYQAFAAAAKQASTPALNDKLSALAQYKPKPEPEPEPETVAKAEPPPEPEPEKVAKAEPLPEPEASQPTEAADNETSEAAPEPETVAKAEPLPEPGASQPTEAAENETTETTAPQPSKDETSRTDAPAPSDQQPEQDSEENQRAVLVSAANDPDNPLKERLEARNMLMSMSQQPGN